MVVGIFEERRDAAALEAHFGTPHMAALLEQVAGPSAAPPAITRYEIAPSTPM